ncbi:MAG TPA: hypothetical protein VG938_04390 [Verrucomicrobiae bacterium]|nr:hypothetical protein [Verrucomicrobiae bacterium]
MPASTARPPAIVSDYQAPLAGTSGVERELRITPEAVLASVNGHILSAEAVLPPGSSGQSVSREVCEYYRQRAIDRELIFQTASAQHVVLNESQQQQLANLQRLRQQQGPGLVRDLAGGPEELSFELRDDEAFMLQTSLMENSGASPNVTSQQVSDYYQWHIAEFGELPTDEPSRQEAWSRIDFEIRQTLASGVRSDFQRKLADYMQRIKTGANIQLTPLASFANTSE